jgi:hypothetical protein
MTDPKPDDMPTNPVPANDPSATTPPPLTLLGHESFGEMGLLALDAYAAEKVLGYERRKIDGRFKWRAPRDVDANEPAQPWQSEPPRMTLEDYGAAMIVLQRAGEKLRFLWRIGCKTFEGGGARGIAFLAELGSNRALATSVELACMIAIAKVDWTGYELVRAELEAAAVIAPVQN